MSIQAHATVADLYAVEGKAELVNGELVPMCPTGDAPNYAVGRVFIALAAYEEQYKTGRAVTDGAGFLVNLPHRQSFSPDAAFHVGPHAGMKFLVGAPVFAVEVRSEGDYGRRMEQEMATKRADYFAAGTLVVWDVDLQSPNVVRVYRATDLTQPTIYRRGDLAEAEPAVPGWTMPVDKLFAG